MTYYNIDNSSRLRIYFLAALAGIGIQFGLSAIKDLAAMKIAAPSAFMIFGVVVWIYDVALWKTPLFNLLHSIPNLQGVWSGQLTRINPSTGEAETRNVTLKITQTWTRMNLVFEGQRSKSRSQVIALFVEDHQNITLKWIYDAKDNKGVNKENLYGEGTTELTLSGDALNRKLAGYYYSSKLRKGSISLSFRRK